jgi:hypothetical protein
LNLSQPLEIAQYRSDNCLCRRGVFPLFEPVRSDNGVESHRAGASQASDQPSITRHQSGAQECAASDLAQSEESSSALRVRVSEKEGVPQMHVHIRLMEALGTTDLDCT